MIEGGLSQSVRKKHGENHATRPPYSMPRIACLPSRRRLGAACVVRAPDFRRVFFFVFFLLMALTLAMPLSDL